MHSTKCKALDERDPRRSGDAGGSLRRDLRGLARTNKKMRRRIFGGVTYEAGYMPAAIRNPMPKYRLSELYLVR